MKRNLTSMSKKKIENEIFDSISHETNNKRRGAKMSSNFIIIISRSPEKLSLVTLVTNHHKSLLLPLEFRPWSKFEKQKSL